MYKKKCYCVKDKGEYLELSGKRMQGSYLEAKKSSLMQPPSFTDGGPCSCWTPCADPPSPYSLNAPSPYLLPPPSRGLPGLHASAYPLPYPPVCMRRLSPLPYPQFAFTLPPSHLLSLGFSTGTEKPAVFPKRVAWVWVR